MEPGFIMKYEKPIKILLAGTGLLFILAGLFVDFSPLKTLGDSLAEDGICEPCGMLDHSLALLFLLGLSLICLAFFLTDILAWNLPEKKTYVLVALFIAIGLILRLNLASNTFLWQDEAETAIDSINLYETGTPQGYYKNLPINYASVGKKIDDPLFSFDHSNPSKAMVHGWLPFVISGAFGMIHKSAFFMRFPFSLLFIGSAVLLYVLCMKVAKDRMAATLAVLLYSTNPVMCSNEMELRYYSLIVLISLLAIYLLTDLSTTSRKVSLTAVLVLAYYAHLTTFLALSIITIYVHLQSIKKPTDHLLITFGILLIQSYAFNEFTEWQIKSHLPLFDQLPLFCLKLAYPVGLGLLALLRLFRDRVNDTLRNFDFNKVGYLILLITLALVLHHKTPYYWEIVFSLAILGYFAVSRLDNEKYFTIYSLLLLVILPSAVKSAYRNVLPALPILIMVISILVVMIIRVWGSRMKMVGIFVVLLMFSLAVRDAVDVLRISSIHGNEYLPELISELEDDKYADNYVFVEHEHFPLLFYTDLSKLYYIWNMNPEFFKNTNEKYFLVLEPQDRESKCRYYYQRYRKLVKKCEENPRFYLDYALKGNCGTKTLSSGVQIIECN